MTDPILAREDCPFCAISAAFPPSALPPPATKSLSSNIIPSSPITTNSSLEPPLAYTVLSTPHLVAFLDHAPISRGHLLVTTRHHREKLSEVPIADAAALGSWLPVLSRVVARTVEPEAVGGADWNVVQNNGARAAQVVPHVHFHIIPRTGKVPSLEAKSWTVFGRGQRMDLEEEDALHLVSEMKQRIREELQRITREEGEEAVRRLHVDAGQGGGERGWREWFKRRERL